MVTGFGQIFWGLLITALDLRINGLDILPDGLGYVLAATGANKLATHSSRFGTAGLICWVLAVLWLIVEVAKWGLAGVVLAKLHGMNK